MTILKIENVVKRFKNKTAVDGASFEIQEGVIFGLLGPNGAGKTTLIRIITSIFNADEGVIYFNGEKLNTFHPSRIGYMPEERGLYKKMKVGEQLLYLSQLKGMTYDQARKSIIHWMKKFKMEDWWTKKVEELSKGMQQKVQFISTIAHDPKLIILDEPFTGLDPVNTELIKEEINNLRNNGATIIFSTHRMEQVEEICEDIVLINEGKVILEGKVSDIKERYKEHKFSVEFYDKVDVSLFEDLNIDSFDGFELVFKSDKKNRSKELIKYFVDKDMDIKSFNEVLPTLNDIFIKLVTEG